MHGDVVPGIFPNPYPVLNTYNSPAEAMNSYRKVEATLPFPSQPSISVPNNPRSTSASAVRYSKISDRERKEKASSSSGPLNDFQRQHDEHEC